MLCFFVRKKLHEFLGLTLAQKEYARVAQHLKVCVACRQRADELKVILQAAQQGPALKPSAAFWEDFKADLDKALNERIAYDAREHSLSRGVGLRLFPKPVLAYLAILVFMLGAGFSGYRFYLSYTRQSSATQALVNEAVILDEISEVAGLSVKGEEILEELIFLDELRQLPAQKS
jgi:predicted anti-sigma-YlaC factor YlaD